MPKKVDVTVYLPANGTRQSINLEGLDLEALEVNGEPNAINIADALARYMSDSLRYEVNITGGSYNVRILMNMEYEFDFEDEDAEYDSESDLQYAFEVGNVDVGEFLNYGDGSADQITSVDVREI